MLGLFTKSSNIVLSTFLYENITAQGTQVFGDVSGSWNIQGNHKCIHNNMCFSTSDVHVDWVRHYDSGINSSVDIATAMIVDDTGNVYVTGYSYSTGTGYDYATIKYDKCGIMQWVVRYNGPANNDDWAYDIAADDKGNVYVAGYSSGLGTMSDYTIIKYNSVGDEQWIARYNGLGNRNDIAYGIALDDFGNVYVTGEIRDSNNYADWATIKYNSDGIEQWILLYDGPMNGNDHAYDIAVDNLGNVYVTGESFNSNSRYDYATIVTSHIIRSKYSLII